MEVPHPDGEPVRGRIRAELPAIDGGGGIRYRSAAGRLNGAVDRDQYRRPRRLKFRPGTGQRLFRYNFNQFFQDILIVAPLPVISPTGRASFDNLLSLQDEWKYLLFDPLFIHDFADPVAPGTSIEEVFRIDLHVESDYYRV